MNQNDEWDEETCLADDWSTPVGTDIKIESSSQSGPPDITAVSGVATRDENVNRGNRHSAMRESKL